MRLSVYDAPDEKRARLARLEELLASPPRELTQSELIEVLPCRGPSRHPINRVRVGVWRLLRSRGFTWRGGARK